MTELMSCIKDKSTEEVLEVFNSYLMREDVKRLIACKDGKEVVYVKQVSAQPERKKGEWVPCSERLPEVRTEVLVSIHDISGDTGFDYSTVGWMTTDRELWIVDDEENNYVTAWQPLPEPYRGEQE